MSLSKLRMITLPKLLDVRGNLSFLEGNNHVPFDILRSYWIYDVPGGQARGGHAFKKQEEVIIALSGSFEVCVSNGKSEQRILLNRSYNGLYIPNGLWRSMENFSTNSLALVLSSTKYEEEDYIRDFDTYKNYIKL